MLAALSNYTLLKQLGLVRFFSLWLTSEIYKEILALLNKRRGFLHDEARPNSAAPTVEAIRHLKFEILPRPPHSSDLAPSDDRMIGPLKAALLELMFDSDDNVKDAVHTLLRWRPITFFPDGVKKLVYRYIICVEKRVIMLINDALSFTTDCCTLSN
jgi:hypothetical protein